jgi:transcription antitermination factor NusG
LTAKRILAYKQCKEKTMLAQDRVVRIFKGVFKGFFGFFSGVCPPPV